MNDAILIAIMLAPDLHKWGPEHIHEARIRQALTAVRAIRAAVAKVEAEEAAKAEDEELLARGKGGKRPPAEH